MHFKTKFSLQMIMVGLQYTQLDFIFLKPKERSNDFMYILYHSREITGG